MKAAIFDLDGTLLDSMHIWLDLGNRVVEKLHIPISKDINIYDTLKDMSLDESAEYFASLLDYKLNKDDIINIYYDIISDFYENEAELKPNVENYIKKLYEKKIALCLATETDMQLAKKALKRVGLLKYFQCCICSKEVGKGKKYPDIFFEALKKLNCDIKDVVIYEDALYAAQTAKEAGFTVHSIYDKSQRKYIKSIREISDLYKYDFADYIQDIDEF
jgi:HAD superfamily hydrolase (TIGR01509 family)